VCCGEEEGGGGVKIGEEMEVDGQVQSGSLEEWLRGVVRRKVEWEQRWKTAT
jgi:exosome complex component RRP46